MKLTDILAEKTDFAVYQGMGRVTHSEDITVQNVGEMLRAVPGVLTINQVTHNSENNTAILKIKLLTTKSAEEAYEAFRQNSLARIPEIKKIEIANKTIEKKK